MSSSSLRHLAFVTSDFAHPSLKNKSFAISRKEVCVRSSLEFGTRLALVVGKADEGRHTLRITLQETAEAIEMKLEGRVAGPWANELERVWVEKAPQLRSRRLIIDLENVTYADAAGKQVLRGIYSRTNAKFVGTTPSSQFLAEEITSTTVAQEGD